LAENLAEETLTLSCPVAARCCLLNREPLRFEQIERDLSRMSVSYFSAGELLQPALLPMQGAALGILQRYIEERPDLRFALLGFFLDRADELAQSGRAGEIENCGQPYLSGELDGEAEQTLRLCQGDVKDYIRYMLTVLELFYGDENRHFERISVQPYLDNVMNAYGIQSETVVLSEVAERYERIREAYCDKIYGEYGYIWTNYFLNHYLSMLYPYYVHEKVTVAYEFFVTVCKLIEFFALALIDRHKNEICEDDMIELLRYVDNKIIHNSNDRMKLLQMIKDGEHGFLDVMRLLLDGGCR
jgi:lysine-N-methylase